MGLIKRMVYSIQSRTPIMLLFRFLLRPFINSRRVWRFVSRLPLVGRMKLKLPSRRTLILETDRTDDIYKLLFWRGFRGHIQGIYCVPSIQIPHHHEYA